MVRTRDSGARKAVAAKAPRKVLAASSGGGMGGMGSPSGKVSKYAGGNAYCPRPTPDWQKGIGAFVVRKPAAEKENSEPTEEPMEAAAAASSAAAAEGSSSSSAQTSTEAAEAADNSSQSSSDEPACSTNSQPEESSSPIKKNGLISDSDEDE